MFAGKMKNSLLTTEPMGYPSGKIKQAVKYMTLKLRGKI